MVSHHSFSIFSSLQRGIKNTKRIEFPLSAHLTFIDVAPAYIKAVASDLTAVDADWSGLKFLRRKT